mmetsp:Transcript_74216/g.131223  ORF Transcript_74216/g.131223 Transcript_74216/m.131223 type:complete len:199 (-) Transcript_74216:125-721(-)
MAWFQGLFLLALTFAGALGTQTKRAVVSSTGSVEDECHWEPFYVPPHQYCHDPLWKADSSLGLDDCKSRCDQDGACKFISFWESNGDNWCHETTACTDIHTQDPDHNITIEKKVCPPRAENPSNPSPGLMRREPEKADCGKLEDTGVPNCVSEQLGPLECERRSFVDLGTGKTRPCFWNVNKPPDPPNCDWDGVTECV